MTITTLERDCGGGGSAGAGLELLGMPLDCLTEVERAAVAADGAFECAAGDVECSTPNLDILRRYKKDAGVRGLFHGGEEGADILLADGMPLVWASRMAGGSQAVAGAGGGVFAGGVFGEAGGGAWVAGGSFAGRG